MGALDQYKVYIRVYAHENDCLAVCQRMPLYATVLETYVTYTNA